VTPLRLFTAIAAGVWTVGVAVFAPAQTHPGTDVASFKPLTYPIDATAFEQNLTQKEREIYQLIENLVAVRSKRTLGCDDATMKALGEKTGASGKQLTMLKWQRAGLREHLRWCLEFGKTESGVKQSLDLLLTYEEQIADVLAQMVHESQPVLGVAKSAQLYLFVDDFERFLASRVAEASKGAPPQPDVESAAAAKAPATTDKRPADDFDAFQTMLRAQNRDVPLTGLGGDDVVKLVDALLVVRLAQALDINKEETVKLFAHIGKVKDQLHELKWQIGHNRAMLRDAIAAGGPAADIQKQLDDLLIEEKAVASLVREFVEGAGKDITVAQSAKMYLFLGDFEAYIVGLLERAQA
jgi:hypothetical protein